MPRAARSTSSSVISPAHISVFTNSTFAVIACSSPPLNRGDDWLDAVKASPTRLLLQCGDARKRLAFHPFEEGAASGRNIGEIAGHARLIERRDGISATGDRNQTACLGFLGGETRRRHRRLVEG